MDDVEAEKQIQQMVGFILNEAKNQATGISEKADEDFDIEKLKLVQSMKEKIRADLEKQTKSIETKRAIDRSTAINHARLKKIEARQICMEKLSDDCGSKLKEVCKIDQQYKQVLVDLIVQGALKLMEEEVVVRCRAVDLSAVKSVLDTAASRYASVVAKATNAKVKLRLSVDKRTDLPPNCLGGVVLLCQNGSISVDNTLDTRLRLVMENDRPTLRGMLFPNK